MKIALFSLLLSLMSCHSPPEKALSYVQQEICGREEQKSMRRPVYRAKVPKNWIRIDPKGVTQDTREPVVSFHTDDGLIITVHTFPSENLEERIPPQAQVARWKGQVGEVDSCIKQACYGGFIGLCFEAPTLLAWSMQLDLEHYQLLHFLAQSAQEQAHYRQMRADYTIKAVAPHELLTLHRDELLLFANSFELIQAIPKRT